MNTISRRGLLVVVLVALVYTAPVLAGSNHEEQQKRTSELHVGKSAVKVNANQEYAAKDERVFSWSDSSLGWVFGLALFGFVLMSNRNRV